MKKIILSLMIMIGLIAITGCGNSEIADENNNDSSNSNLKEESKKVENKTYYCEEKNDDDWYYYLYYENDKLAKAKVLAAKYTGLFEDYSEIKAEAMGYDGVSLSKDSDFIYFDIDIKKSSGLKYFTELLNLQLSEETVSELESDTSLSKVNEIMSYNWQCEER